MQELELSAAEYLMKKNRIILPKINKKAQNVQRIMSHQLD